MADDLAAFLMPPSAEPFLRESLLELMEVFLLIWRLCMCRQSCYRSQLQRAALQPSGRCGQVPSSSTCLIRLQVPFRANLSLWNHVCCPTRLVAIMTSKLIPTKFTHCSSHRSSCTYASSVPRDAVIRVTQSTIRGKSPGQDLGHASTRRTRMTPSSSFPRSLAYMRCIGISIMADARVGRLDH
jgi:hypothetical protein